MPFDPDGSALHIFPRSIMIGAQEISEHPDHEGNILMLHMMTGLDHFHHIRVFVLAVHLGAEHEPPPYCMRAGFLDGRSYGIPDEPTFDLDALLQQFWPVVEDEGPGTPSATEPEHQEVAAQPPTPRPSSGTLAA